ncbi:MAG TPA: PIG-L family deacetylase [Acidimicrobiales bacterium]|nr:PIG-L family deacetylase [Acidimicrobiales bacterium]
MTVEGERTDKPLTLMAVHAHPDDEATSTGGILARYSAEGVQTILVTCTNGEQGDAPGGIKPGEDGHHPEEVAAVRLAELRTSAALLGISHLELLDYRDSGMDGWVSNKDPGVFCNVPLADVSSRVAELMRYYRPQVVVTYDENGNYGHPDHIQAHRAAVAAAESSGIPAKVYYPAVPRSGFLQIREMLRSSGINDEFDVPDDFGVPDEKITTVIDVSSYVGQKREALAAHASQTQNFFFNRIPDDVVTVMLSREYYTLRSAPDGQAREDDLFAGL